MTIPFDCSSFIFYKRFSKQLGRLDLDVPPFVDLWDPSTVPLLLLAEDEKDGACLMWWLPTL
jgi:hypothetical protein